MDGPNKANNLALTQPLPAARKRYWLIAKIWKQADTDALENTQNYAKAGDKVDGDG